MNGHFEVGVQLPEVEREVRWPELRDIARVAEEVGFDSVWVGDHLLYREDPFGTRGPWEAWSVLAALAEATERVALGPLVAATPFHSPAMLAKKAGTVDEISGGRLILGLGAGWNRTEFEGFGFPFDHRVDRFDEALTIIRTLLREGEIDFAGRYHTLKECELAPRPRPDIPLMIGSNGPRMLRVALPHVDMWNSWYLDFGNEVPGLTRLRDTVDEACREVGRDPGQIERTVAVFVQFPGGSGRAAGDEIHRDDTNPITGTPEEMAARLTGFRDAGISHVQLVLDPINASTVEAMGEVLTLVG